MASPSPVPSIWRFTVLSACLNASNTPSCSSFFIPIPVSFTIMQRLTISSATAVFWTVKDTPPSFVYLTALFSIFISTSCIRVSSPYSSAGMDGSISTLNSRFFLLANVLICIITLNIRSLVLYLLFTSSIFPDSIFEISSISLIIARRLYDKSLIFATASS